MSSVPDPDMRRQSAFLDEEDVEFMTGYESPSYQMKWCKENGVRAYLSSKGKVRVPRTAIDGKPANDGRWSPDFSKIASKG